MATVRRVEGVLLFPTTDARGVHWFRDTDVEALAENVKRGRVKLVNSMRSASAGQTIVRGKRHSSCRDCQAKDLELNEIRAKLETLQRSPFTAGSIHTGSQAVELALQIAELLGASDDGL